jgi:RND family efflux transporter MFP subunit
MSDEPTSKDLLNADKAKEQMGKVPWIAHTLVSIGILFVAFTIVGSMFASKPEARKWGGRPAPAVTVETTQLSATDYQVWIDSYGSATPLTMTKLVSDVSGRVIEVSEKIRAGASFEKDEVLLRIEPRDYQIAVDVAEAAVADAEVRYQQELAEADIARQEWNIRPKNNKGQALALREPQVKAAQAALQSAKARLEQAKLDLERTEVKAPFKGKVLSQMVDLGQVVSPSQAIAEIYATEHLEIRLPIKTQDLHQFDMVMLENTEQRPRVILESSLGNQTYRWFGEIVRSEGAYDRTNRMLYVVARVEDPFTPTETAPAMRVGQFFEARIEGKLLRNVYTLPRRAVSQENQISVVDEGQLLKLPVTPLWTDRDMVVVQATNSLQLNAGEERRFSSADQLILTPTANLVSGTRVKLIGEETRRPGVGNRTANNDSGGSTSSGRSAQ